MNGKLKISLASMVLAISIIAFTGCSIEDADSGDGFLTMSIESPENNAILETNLLQVTGIISHPEAEVLINGLSAIVDNTGNFYGYIDLKDGDNTIKATAYLNGHKTSHDIEVALEPPLVLIVDPFYGEKDVDYTVTPVEICGYVSDPAAKVTVNEMPVSIKKDGTYCKSLLLKEGKNNVNVLAILHQKSDNVREEIRVTRDGEAFSIPRPGEAMLSYISTIELKAGETRLVDIELWTGKRDITRPRELEGDIWRVSELYGQEQLTMPEGLDVYIEPPIFTAHPGRAYSLTLVASAMSDIAPGQYYFSLNIGLRGGFTIIVENQ